jgi:hypothetical protein
MSLAVPDVREWHFGAEGSGGGSVGTSRLESGEEAVSDPQGVCNEGL